KYNKLYKDCFGNIHLISKDSACQVFLLDDKFVLTHHISRTNFDEYIPPTIINTDNYLYIKTLIYNWLA
ncbi:MAG: hypothetical protein LBH92_08875, partial [Bacteroidales bacterium]|nr:hypothetical protein [Bacteroidales bacterium]